MMQDTAATPALQATALDDTICKTSNSAVAENGKTEDATAHSLTVTLVAPSTAQVTTLVPGIIPPPPTLMSLSVAASQPPTVAMPVAANVDVQDGATMPRATTNGVPLPAITSATVGNVNGAQQPAPFIFPVSTAFPTAPFPLMPLAVWGRGALPHLSPTAMWPRPAANATVATSMHGNHVSIPSVMPTLPMSMESLSAMHALAAPRAPVPLAALASDSGGAAASSASATSADSTATQGTAAVGQGSSSSSMSPATVVATVVSAAPGNSATLEVAAAGADATPASAAGAGLFAMVESPAGAVAPLRPPMIFLPSGTIVTMPRHEPAIVLHGRLVPLMELRSMSRGIERSDPPENDVSAALTASAAAASAAAATAIPSSLSASSPHTPSAIATALFARANAPNQAKLGFGRVASLGSVGLAGPHVAAMQAATPGVAPRTSVEILAAGPPGMVLRRLEQGLPPPPPVNVYDARLRVRERRTGAVLARVLGHCETRIFEYRVATAEERTMQQLRDAGNMPMARPQPGMRPVVVERGALVRRRSANAYRPRVGGPYSHENGSAPQAFADASAADDVRRSVRLRMTASGWVGHDADGDASSIDPDFDDAVLLGDRPPGPGVKGITGARHRRSMRRAAAAAAASASFGSATTAATGVDHESRYLEEDDIDVDEEDDEEDEFAGEADYAEFGASNRFRGVKWDDDIQADTLRGRPARDGGSRYTEDVEGDNVSLADGDDDGGGGGARHGTGGGAASRQRVVAAGRSAASIKDHVSTATASAASAMVAASRAKDIRASASRAGAAQRGVTGSANRLLDSRGRKRGRRGYSRQAGAAAGDSDASRDYDDGDANGHDADGDDGRGGPMTDHPDADDRASNGIDYDYVARGSGSRSAQVKKRTAIRGTSGPAQLPTEGGNAEDDLLQMLIGMREESPDAKAGTATAADRDGTGDADYRSAAAVAV